MWTRRRVLLVMPLLAVAVTAAAPLAIAQADAADKYVGVWSGSWDGGGGGGGGFELTLQHEKDKPITGKVAVTGEPEYTAPLTSVSFEGAKMTAKYDFPIEPSLQVTLVATFEGDAATGTWSVAEKGSTNEVASGGWKVKRGEKK